MEEDVPAPVVFEKRSADNGRCIGVARLSAAKTLNALSLEMIDLLAVLEQKTRGNLSFEESNFLSRVLYDLRLAFVEVSRPPAK